MIVTIGNNTVKIYDSVNMPVSRYMLFNRYAVIDAAVGGSMESIEQRLVNILQYNDIEDTESVKQEAKNALSALSFISKGILPIHYCFCALVYEINGKPYTSPTLSDDTIKEIQGKLLSVSLTYKVLRDTVTLVKKKLKVK